MSPRASQPGTIVALAAATLTGCVLLIDSTTGPLTSTCHVANESSACGSCMVAQCQTALDACCADANCRPELTSVDDCGNTGKCSLDLTTTQASGVLGACVAKACAAACTVTGSAPPQGYTSSCSASFVGGKQQCFCEPPGSGASSNATTCDPAVLPGAVCCGDANYPKPSTTCTCMVGGCDGTFGGGCNCSLYSSSSTTSCGAGYAHCCQTDTGTCECKDSACSPSYETEVPVCDIQHLGCSGSQRLFASCSY